MNVLGKIGQMYTLILLFTLFLGFGLVIWKWISSFMTPQKTNENKYIKNNNKIGGFFMNNGWFKLAAFSFFSIIVSVVILGFVSSNNMSANNIHQQHLQQGISGNGMGNMNNGMNMQGNDNAEIQQQLNQMQNQINQLQQQLNGMNGNGGNSMQQNGGGSSMPQQNNSGGSMGGMGGMM